MLAEHTTLGYMTRISIARMHTAHLKTEVQKETLRDQSLHNRGKTKA
jgi:hypothetical protein